jgi:tripartite ATP-independent transporter DctP family solute receptor
VVAVSHGDIGVPTILSPVGLRIEGDERGRIKRVHPNTEVLTMKVLHRVLAMALVLSVGIVGFTGICFAAPGDPQVKLMYAGDLPVGNHLTRSQDYFAERVKQLSNGRVKIEVYAAGTLFTAKDLTKALPSGAADMGLSLVSLWSGLVPAANFPEMPLFFDGWSHAWRVYDSEVGDILKKDMEKVGVKVLFWLQDGKAGFASKRPLKTLDDFKGKRIRAPGELASHTIKYLGGAPTFLGGGEVYLALQRGTVDGAISSLTSFCDRKYYEVTKYVTEPDFMFGLYGAFINLSKWNSLPADVQKVLLTAGKDTQDWGRGEVEKSDAAALNELQKKGMEVYSLPKAEKDRWRKALKPVYDIAIQKVGESGQKMYELADKLR